MKTKTEITVNQHGLEFETNLIFVDEVNDWFVDDYEMAKMALYKDATQLLPFAEEQEGIAKILSIGVANYLNGAL